MMPFGGDELHVKRNREMYRAKLEAVQDRLAPVWKLDTPDGGFYFWPETPLDDEEFVRLLFEQTNVSVLPGRYLSRDDQGVNPGNRRVRMAMVPPLEVCLEAADRIAEFLRTLSQA